MIQIPPLHPSNMMVWQACGKQFDLEVLHGVPPAFLHPAAVNGTALHIVLDRVHRDNLWESPEDQIGTLYKDAFHWAVENPSMDKDRGLPIRWGKLQDEFTAHSNMSAEGMDMINGYRRDPRNRTAKVQITEGRWRANLAGIPWEGRLDQARDRGDGTSELLDWKSGVDNVTDLFLSMWPQGLTYAIASENAEFMQGGTDEWKPLHLSVKQCTYVKLRDYIPYLKSGSRKDGSTYKKGDVRGPVFRSIEITPQVLASHLQEMRFFSEAVRSGRVERRPSTYQCNRCRVWERCVRDFRGSLDQDTVSKFKVTEEDYDTQGNQ